MKPNGDVPSLAGSSKEPAAATKPKTADMVNDAIRNLQERGGSSLQAIKHYMTVNFGVDAERLSPFIKKYVKTAVLTGKLVQTKGRGANGSFRLPGKDKPEVPLEAGLAMTGSGRGMRSKAASRSGGSGKLPSNKKQKPSPSGDWCADCWAPVQATCGRDGHRLIEKDMALQEAKAKLKTLKQDVVDAQARVDEVTRALTSKESVLELRVGRVEEESLCLLSGGAIRLTLAASATAAEKTVICQALEGLTIDYTDFDAPHNGEVDVTNLAEFLDKLPSFEVGEETGQGTVFLSDDGVLFFHLDSQTMQGEGAKLFGRVDDGLDKLRALGCDGKCRDCQRGLKCSQPTEFSTTLSDVKFVA